MISLQIISHLKSFAPKPPLLRMWNCPSNVTLYLRSSHRGTGGFKIECCARQRKHPTNLLEGLVEADGGCAVKDDIDVFHQDAVILSAQIQLWLCEVTVHCYDLVGKGRLFLLQSFK